MNYQRYSGDDLLLSLMALGSDKSAMHKIWMEHIQNLKERKSTKATSGEVKLDTYEWMSKIFSKLNPRAVESVLSSRSISANFLETASVNTQTEKIKGAHYDTPRTNSDYGYFVVELKKDGKGYLKLKLNGEKVEDTTKPYLALIVSTMKDGNEKTRYLFIEEKRTEKRVGNRVIKDIKYRTIGSDTLELNRVDCSTHSLASNEIFANLSNSVDPKTTESKVSNEITQVSSGADNSLANNSSRDNYVEGQITLSEASKSSGQNNSDHIQSLEPNADEEDDHEWDTWYKRPTKRSSGVNFKTSSNAKTTSVSAPNVTTPTVTRFNKVDANSSNVLEGNKVGNNLAKATLPTEQKVMRTENGNYKVDDDGQITILF